MLPCNLAGGKTKLRAYVMVKKKPVTSDVTMLAPKRGRSGAAKDLTIAAKRPALPQLHELLSFVPRLVTLEKPYNTRS